MANVDSQRKVLLVGYRRPIVDRLRGLGIPFAIWHDGPVSRQLPDAIARVTSEPFGRDPRRIRTNVARLFGEHAPFTHVIAGTEASVVAASVARRVLGARASRDSVIIRCHDKRQMKDFLMARGIPMTRYLYDPDGSLAWPDVRSTLGQPVVVKPVNTSGGRGQSVIADRRGWELTDTRRCLVEKFVDADEISVESFISGGQVRFTNITEYVVKRHINLVPATIPDRIAAEVLELNQRVIECLRIHWGMTHAEFYLHRDGILFGEIAIRPPGGYIMDLISLAYDFDAWSRFVGNEIELDATSSNGLRARQWASCAILHSGPGHVLQCPDQDPIATLPGFQKYHCSVRIGDRVGTRTGAGQSTAYCLFSAPDPDVARRSAQHALTHARFAMEPQPPEDESPAQKSV